jgi:hypothetical protein
MDLLQEQESIESLEKFTARLMNSGEDRHAVIGELAQELQD